MSRLITLASGIQVAINNVDTTLDQLSYKVRDSFYRLKVANPFTLLDLKQTSPASALFYSSAQVAGSGTALTYSQNKASSTLSVSAQTFGHRVIQSRQRTNYQPGKSQSISLSSIIKTPKAGITKRLGYFDDNNGCFFEFTNNNIYLVIRSKVSGSVVDTKIARSNWNVDKLDGNGPSGMTLNLNTGQIYCLSLEWLGVGSVFFYIFHKGEPVLIHQEDHNNVVTSVYMSTPVLPIRAEIRNDGTGDADDMEIICGSVVSEGGVERNGANRAVSRYNSPLSTPNSANVFYPLISLRINSNYFSTEIFPSSYSILSTTNSTFLTVTVINPTIISDDTANWQTIPNSSLQYDISRTNAISFSDGQILSARYGNSSQETINQDVNSFWTIGSDVLGNADEFVLAVANIGSSRLETYYASLNFREVL